MHVNGTLMFQNQDLDIDIPDNATDVPTIAGGMQGVAPGPGQTSISITNAIPRAGFDFDFAEAKENFAELDIKVQQLGNPKTLKGRFLVRGWNGKTSSGNPFIETMRITSVGPLAPRFK